MNKPILKITTSYIKTEKDKKRIASFIYEMSKIVPRDKYSKISTIVDNEFQTEIYQHNENLNDMYILIRNVVYNEKINQKDDIYALFKIL